MSKRGDNIYKRKDGRWEGRFPKERGENGKMRFGYVYAKTYHEAKEKLLKARQEVKIPSPPNKRLFGNYCDEWIIVSRNRVKESTYIKYHNTVNKHIKRHLGEYMPDRLNTVVIEEFSNNLLENGLSTKTVRDTLTVLKGVLKYMRRQLGTSFPEIEVVYPKESRKEMRVLSPDEQARFVQYLLTDMDEVKFSVLLALLTGLRIGEICALKWQDISIEDKLIKVSFTMQRLQTLKADDAKTKISIGDAKSETSKRVIPLTDYAVSLCKKMQVQNERAYLLTASEHRFLEPRALQYKLEKYTRDCSLTGVHFHTLRHTFATRCVEVGFEIKSLSEVLGHSSAKVTLDRYVHSSLELKRANMEKLAAIGF